MSKQSRKERTYARNRPVVSRRGLENVWESDGVYVLKLVLVTLLGLTWLRLSEPVFSIAAIPVGGMIGAILVATVEKAQFNRKIMYAVLVITMIISFFLEAGIVI